MLTGAGGNNVANKMKKKMSLIQFASELYSYRDRFKENNISIDKIKENLIGLGLT